MSLIEQPSPLDVRTVSVCVVASTANAMSPSGVNARVFRSVLVALRTMGLFTFVVSATAHVLFARDWLQVCRIHASALATQVIEFKALRYGTDELFVHQPVRSVALSSPSTTGITTPVGTPSPEPTVIGLSIGGKFSQQLFNRFRLVGHSGNLNFPDCRAGGCFEHPSAHSFNHREV